MRTHTQKYARPGDHTQHANMSFDEIFDLTAGVYSYFHSMMYDRIVLRWALVFTRHEMYSQEALFQADRTIVADFLFSSLLAVRGLEVVRQWGYVDLTPFGHLFFSGSVSLARVTHPPVPCCYFFFCAV